jgi:hypothetical protein
LHLLSSSLHGSGISPGRRRAWQPKKTLSRDVKFIDGYPGKDVALARRNGDMWYVAGINGEKSPRTITLDIPFVRPATTGMFIGDSDTGKDFVERTVEFAKPVRLTLLPYGGLVVKTVSP